MDRPSCQVVGFGQCCWDRFELVERFPAIDEKVETSGCLEQGGGPVATALVCLARLGTRCAFLGSIGHDREGSLIREGLVRETVDCDHLQVDATGSSQRATIIVEEKTGLRTIFWQRGERRPFVVSAKVVRLVESCRVLLLDGLDISTAVELATVARRAGVTTLLDGGTLRPRTDELLPLIDHLVVSEKFARQFSGSRDPETALDSLLEPGAEAVTVTAGQRGSWTISGEGVFHQPAFSVQGVDTTGCGDVFHGGYVYGLVQGWPLRRVARFAAACAALNATRLGGRGKLPSLEEALQLEVAGVH